MARYIDAEGFKAWLLRQERISKHYAIQMLDETPTADVAPVRHGGWKKLDMHRGMEQYRCSICRSEAYVPTCMDEPMYAYCPNCGAKMDGGEEE